MSPPREKTDWAALVEQAAGGADRRAVLDARERLAGLRLTSPQALPAILAALAGSSRPALEAAGDWLFQAEPAWELSLQLAAQAPALLALAQARPGSWCREGLAGVLALRGGRPLAGLLTLARGQAWAGEVVACLRPDLSLSGSQSPAAWLARQALGPAGRARVPRWLARGDWPRLAQAGRPAQELAWALGGPQPLGPEAIPLAWPGGSLELLEQVAGLTAQEGLAAWRLAQRTSQATGRLVLLLGNASLGGPPLWALPGPWREGWPSPPAPRPIGPKMRGLARLRACRLGGPPLESALWELSCATALAGRGRRELARLLDQATPWLPTASAQAIWDGSLPLAPGGLPLPQALQAARAALAQALALEHEGLAALAQVLALAGQRPRPGQALVLPWADKFVASTAKAGDHQYLAGLMNLLAQVEPRPLLLMLDDTPHPSSASLGLAMAEAGRLCPGLILRGLGAFAGQPEPADLEAALLEASREALLVAFRPLPGPQPAAGLEERLAGRGAHLPLTPVSRDGAAFLLAGTRLAGLTLATPEGHVSGPAPWLLTSQGPAHLGQYLRQRVAALAGQPPQAPPAWRACQHLCNLC